MFHVMVSHWNHPIPEGGWHQQSLPRSLSSPYDEVFEVLCNAIKRNSTMFEYRLLAFHALCLTFHIFSWLHSTTSHFHFLIIFRFPTSILFPISHWIHLTLAYILVHLQMLCYQLSYFQAIQGFWPVLTLSNVYQCLFQNQKILSTMMPTEEEKARIIEAQTANNEMPLGTAEQFLLTLGSISELPARLNLWLYKLDYEGIESVGSASLIILFIYLFIDEVFSNATYTMTWYDMTWHDIYNIF